MPPSGSHTAMQPAVSPWYPPRTVSIRERPGRPRPRWACSAIFSATSTDTEPESARKTCSSPSGEIETSLSASRTAGAWVSPPNMTCDIRPAWSASAASSSGTAYPCTADHHDAMPSTTSCPPASRSRTPAADSTTRTGAGSVIEV